ncbi:MAG: hypothetical protein EX272_01105 [Chromatiales bacterium]|nr:MAG: hypothetical protein EX272_01105 [Chromatiales bacterium]
MVHMRPGQRIKFWSPRFENRPDVEPPALLKLLGGLSMFSVAGTLVYAVAVSMGDSGTFEPTGFDAFYIAVLHFILPFGVFYSINMNSPLSRPIIALYALVLSGATIAGKGFLGNLPVDDSLRLYATMAVALLVFGWLYGTPKMRFYYLTISGKTLPPELEARADELRAGPWLGPRGRAILEWFVDHMETLVLLGFIAAVLIAVGTMNP